MISHCCKQGLKFAMNKIVGEMFSGKKQQPAREQLSGVYVKEVKDKSFVESMDVSLVGSLERYK